MRFISKLSYRKRAAFLLIAVNALIFLLSASYAYLVYKAAGEEVIKCAFKRIFHIYCPGCGGSRALLYLFTLDFIRAFFAFPPIYVLLFFLIYLDIRAILSIVKNEKRYFSEFNLNILIVIPAFILLNFLVRNIFLCAFEYDFLGDIIKR